MNLQSLWAVASNIHDVYLTERAQLATLSNIWAATSNLHSNIAHANFSNAIANLNDEYSEVQNATKQPLATLYTGSDFTGTSKQITPLIEYNNSGNFSTAFVQKSIGKGQLSSLKISNGYTATLYDNSNFSGTHI